MNCKEALDYAKSLELLKEEQKRLQQKKHEYRHIFSNLLICKEGVKNAHRLYWKRPDLRNDADFICLCNLEKQIYQIYREDFNRISNSMKIQKAIVNDRQRLVSFYQNKD